MMTCGRVRRWWHGRKRRADELQRLDVWAGFVANSEYSGYVDLRSSRVFPHWNCECGKEAYAALAELEKE